MHDISIQKIDVNFQRLKIWKELIIALINGGKLRLPMISDDYFST